METSLSALIIEDSPSDAELLVASLARAGFRLRHQIVDDAAGVAQALKKESWDIVISDHSMPGFSATGALDMIKNQNLDLPLIIVSGTIEPRVAVAAMKAGAADFVMKDDLTRLIPAIERELRETQNRRVRRKAEQERESFREQLSQSQKMESLGRFAGGVAHDFNNILTAMSGFCHFLLDGMAPEDPKREDIVEIMKAGKRAAALTKQLLAFSRRQLIESRVLDLNGVVADVEKMLRRMLGEEITVETRLASPLGRIKADPAQLEQILINLANYARDAMPGGGSFSIETAGVVVDEATAQRTLDIQPGPHVMLSLRHSGPALEEETRRRIFEPFFALGHGMKGAGLGLAVVYGIVRQCRGGVFVRSDSGSGTTFELYFPRVEEQPSALAVEPSIQLRQGTETILLVEDDEAVRKFCHRVLVQNGYTVLPAPTPEEALRVCREYEQPIDLLISDIVMPVMYGHELAKRITGSRPNIRVLYMSGYSEHGIVRNELVMPEDFLEKPISPNTLLAKVREVLDF